VSSSTLYSCKESKTKSSTFIYKNNRQYAAFRILNSSDYIEYNTATEDVFLSKNIKTTGNTVSRSRKNIIEIDKGIVITKLTSIVPV
jgi:hypothetical protein